MALNVPELEQRLSNLQSQIVSLSQRAERNAPLEQRLSAMADDYAEYLKRWAHTVDRHTRAVSQLEAYISEWKDAGTHVQEDSVHRLKDLEVIIEREFHALQKIHDEPLKQLQEQAASLTAIAGAAQQGFDRTESRLATFEGDFYRALNELTRELRTAVAEIKMQRDGPTAHLDPARQWAFDDVNRLHSQLRDSQGGGRAAGPSLPALDDRPAFPGSRELLPRMTGHVQSDDDAFTSPDAPRRVAESGRADASPHDQPIPRTWRLAVVCLGVALLAVSGLGWRLYGQVRTGADRVQRAELESARATALAESHAATAREEASREIAGAREVAVQAERISSVLAAPDLVRYNLTGDGQASPASGQALWSRSRGLVFSGSGIAPAPPNQQHQLWLLTRVAPVRAGSFSLEADGTVTSVQQAPFVPRPVIGVMVTLEAAGGGETPSGPIVLTSVRSPQ
jgi:hypothetical protein